MGKLNKAREAAIDGAARRCYREDSVIRLVAWAEARRPNLMVGKMLEGGQGRVIAPWVIHRLGSLAAGEDVREQG